jgi:hypothetical protein
MGRRQYFEDVLIALGEKEAPKAEPDAKPLARRKRVRQFVLEDGLIQKAAMEKLGIPKELRQRVIQEAPNSAIGGHFRAQWMTALVAREFPCKGLAQDIKRYVWGCSACHRAKRSNEKPYSLLQPLDIPSSRWERINVDFITKLPATANNGGGIAGNFTIITFINSLTMRAHWEAAWEADLTVERFAEIFIDGYFRLHGLPAAIVSDRDPSFTSDFWQHRTTIWQT